MMSKTFCQMLGHLRTRAGMTKTAVAQAVGITISAIGNFETGRTPAPPLDRVRQLAAAVGATPEETETLLSLAAMERAPEEAGFMQTIAGVNYDLLEPENRKPLPLYGEIPAGPPRKALAEDGEVYAVLEHQAGPGRYVLKVCDDSMGPSIQDGDLVLMEYRDDGPLTEFHNKICAVALDSTATLKRVQVQQSGDRQIVMLKGDSPDSPTESFLLGDREFTVVGVALEIVQRKLA